MATETLRLAEAMEAELHIELARAIRAAVDACNPADFADTDEDAGLELRVQFQPTGAYRLHVGDPRYDTDHTGFWGAGSIRVGQPVTDLDCQREARNLVEDLLDTIATAAA